MSVRASIHELGDYRAKRRRRPTYARSGAEYEKVLRSKERILAAGE